ncbi:MAG: sulfatase [Actinomycetota bacterium]|nr:sulfatase [Actinomycetota bacterium]
MAKGSKPKRTLTRKDFLRAGGIGAAGASLLGSGTLAGCASLSDARSSLPDEYLPGGGPGTNNVVLVILDSLRKDHVGAYGNDWIKTPTLDALARESLLFTRAYPEAMPTIQARRAIHTGMRTWPTRMPHFGWTPIPWQQRTLAETLKKEGYSTFLVTDTYVQFNMNFGRGFEVYHMIRGQERDPYKDASSISEEEMRQRYIILGEGKKARQYLANVRGREGEEDWFAPKVFLGAIDILEEAAGREEPFFLVADCYDPHEPWDPPREYVALYDEGYEGKEPLNDNYGKDDYLTDRQLMRMRALYAAEVTMMDRWLGKFIQRAHELGIMQDTLFVVISDHGHLLGEHGYTGKLPYALYPELTDIVLMIRHPEGKGAGETSGFYASTHDVAPTILSFLGVEQPEPLDGEDLTPLLEGKDPERARDHITQGYYNYVCCRDERRVMFCRTDGADAHLFDAINDADQRRDLAGAEPETVKRMFEEYAQKDAAERLPNF